MVFCLEKRKDQLVQLRLRFQYFTLNLKGGTQKPHKLVMNTHSERSQLGSSISKPLPRLSLTIVMTGFLKLLHLRKACH